MATAANAFSKIISIIIAVMFLVIGLIFFFKYDPDAYDMQGTGTIAEIVERYETSGDDNRLVYDVFIDYTIDGKEYKHVDFFEYDSSMKEGDKVEFYYMSSDPSQIAGSTKDAAPYIGLGAAVLGFIMLVVTVVKIIKKKPM